MNGLAKDHPLGQREQAADGQGNPKMAGLNFWFRPMALRTVNHNERRMYRARYFNIRKISK
jgi:hypothetical protein